MSVAGVVGFRPRQSGHKTFEKKRASSLSHISGYIGTESTANVGCGRLCRVDYLSRKGKWLHLGKLLLVVCIPIFGGWGFTLYSLADNVIQKDAILEAQDTMMKGIRLGRLIFTIQKERDMSLLYISKIGPGTKAFLLEEYDRTDAAFSDMWSWPLEFTTNRIVHFRSKKKLISYINAHRNQLDQTNSDVFDEIKFYDGIVDFFMDWMIENIRQSGSGDTWKSLVVFQKITRCLLDAGAERAYGSMFYARGNFPDEALYDNYFRRIARFSYNYRSATYYSDLVDPLTDTRTENVEYTNAIKKLRKEIRYSNFSGIYNSLTKAEDYFDNVTFRIDYLFLLQKSVAARIVDNINSTVHEHTVEILIYSIAASVVIISCPVIVVFSEALTSNMQAYSKVLVKASDELNMEKNKTELLLYQMLPKTVAKRLKRNSKVESEFFKTSTVMFTSIVNFVQMSIEYGPMELIDLLNVLYSSIDEKITKYDVYKVETINDTYMVVSGVPVPNGTRHAPEIAYLALDIVAMVRHRALLMPRMNLPIQLLLGVNSGSLSAGVVGTVMLRYCLFGDTVNTASRMRSYSQPNRIHISESTYRNLKKTGLFHIQGRGSIDVKGKGQMNTYWLLDAIHKTDRDTPTSGRDWKLQGETESVHDTASVTSRTGQGGSQKKCWQTAKHNRKQSVVVSVEQSSSQEKAKAVQHSFNFDEQYGY